MSYYIMSCYFSDTKAIYKKLIVILTVLFNNVYCPQMFTLSNSLKFSFLFILLSACQSKVNNLNINNKKLSLVKGEMYYNEKPYSGVLFSKTDTLVTYKVTYVKGKKHGKEEKFFFDGKLAVMRNYIKGKKAGKQQAWWNNNQPKLVNHFNDLGKRSGIHREWLSNGQLVKELNFTNGNEDGWQKSWDVNGKIKSNYVVINGERFGLIGYEKCKSGGYVD